MRRWPAFFCNLKLNLCELATHEGKCIAPNCPLWKKYGYEEDHEYAPLKRRKDPSN